MASNGLPSGNSEMLRNRRAGADRRLNKEGDTAMTPDRSSAYGRVIKTLDDMGPSKLHDLERIRIRNAADTLLFAATGDAAALEAIADVEHLARHLIDTDRWVPDRACALADDVAACGPALAEDVPVFEQAAA